MSSTTVSTAPHWGSSPDPPAARSDWGDTLTYLLEVPIDGGGRLLVEAGEEELPGELELAAVQPGEIVAKAGTSLEAALERIRPAVGALRDHLATMSRPDEITVEFGLVIGAETGIVVAKGRSEVHFSVRFTWNDGLRTSDASGTGK